MDGTGVGEDIGVTKEHPFWVGAGRLRTGDELLSATGQTLWVESVEPTEGRQTVYNLEVASAHTYFVGESQAWVHNPTTEINTKSGEYMLSDGTWKLLSAMTDEEKALAHIP